MGLKWYFYNDMSPNFSEKPAFTPELISKPPKGNFNLKVFLNQKEK